MTNVQNNSHLSISEVIL